MVDDLFEVFEDLFEQRKKKGRRNDRDYREDRDREPPGTPPGPRRAEAPLFCVDCGARNEASGRFCLECGKLLPAPGQEMHCIRCAQVVPLTAKFCPKMRGEHRRRGEPVAFPHLSRGLGSVDERTLDAVGP